MVDRTDIDALLISALYGELTPADEARLTAHLESHPADRTALADLTRTRATVRDSRLLAVQLEPPQSVSAMLLREAARRAPREREDASWFHRFVRSFMAHPAMAAAAMLVLVVGVAGTIYVRKGDVYRGPSLAERADSSAAQTASAPQAEPSTAPAEIAAPAGAVTVPPAAPSADVATDQPTAPKAQAGLAGSAAFGVDLAEQEKAEGAVALEQPTARRAKDGYAADERKELRRGAADPVPAPAKPAPVAKLSKKGAGIELRSRELEPRDLDDEQQALARHDGDRLGNGRASVAKNEEAVRGPGQAGPSGGGATPAPATAPTPSAPEQPSAQASDKSAEIVASSGAKAKTPAPAKTVARSTFAQKPSAAPPPPPPPPPAAAAPAADPASVARNEPPADKLTADDAKVAGKSLAKSDDKPVDHTLLAWAAQQHRQVVALVGSNRCREAASAAVAIYNRAPDYYASSVATDRSIKPCLAYVNNERERADRSRAAAKRATSADTPAASPPATRK